jgi:hypothetical protein
MDPTAVLGLLLTLATTLHDRIVEHKIAETNIQFDFQRYKTYLTPQERDLIKQGLRDIACSATAERVFTLHLPVAEWLARNKFKLLPGNGVEIPHMLLDTRAQSFKSAVDLVASERTLLRNELTSRATTSTPVSSAESTS